ncbi:hypothetical protein Rhal01_01397 [Rubritalea halochordaticola]|uniref:Uncharacterized protein n=1 Tax=Rubritalea halochordaticola TaxID=714537 RepID=A0ABP9UXX6_9BACT
MKIIIYTALCWLFGVLNSFAEESTTDFAIHHRGTLLTLVAYNQIVKVEISPVVLSDNKQNTYINLSFRAVGHAGREEAIWSVAIPYKDTSILGDIDMDSVSLVYQGGTYRLSMEYTDKVTSQKNKVSYRITDRKYSSSIVESIEQ